MIPQGSGSRFELHLHYGRETKTDRNPTGLAFVFTEVSRSEKRLHDTFFQDRDCDPERDSPQKWDQILGDRNRNQVFTRQSLNCDLDRDPTFLFRVNRANSRLVCVARNPCWISFLTLLEY